MVQKRRWRRAEAELSQSEQRFRATFQQVAVGMAQVALDGTCLIVNQRLCDILGYTENELVAKSLADLIHPSTMEEAKRFSERFLRGEVTPGSIEVRYCHKLGHTIWVNSCTSLVRDSAGKPRYGVLTLEDTTNRKGFEKQLLLSNGVLRQFAYASAHDLQEPLRNVALTSELLALEMKGQAGSLLETLLSENARAAMRMQRMMKDLLEFTQAIDSDPATVPVADSEFSLASALMNLHFVISESNAEITHTPLPQVAVLPKHMIHVLENLVANAIKYRKSDERPVVAISAKLSGANWVFRVSDNGIGFDPAYGKLIFRLFKRLNLEDQHTSTGMGLAICERIVEHYGGTIWAESQVGEGATFSFTLPEVAVSR
jgi:PAS domain S-box-containing protein